MPTSVLLAVLAAAGLLALAPALVRRYDATERLVAERALSTARVVTRAGSACHRRRRTVPGRRPVNPPRAVVARMRGGAPVRAAVTGPGVPIADDLAPDRAVVAARAARRPGPAPVPSGGDPVSGRPVSGAPVSAMPVSGSPAARRAAARRRRVGTPRAVYRRRRVLLALVLFNIVELVGVALVGPGFWIGEIFAGGLLVAYLVHLRNRAIVETRRRRAEARYAAWIAARQAAVRREQARRAAARRMALERQLAERDRVRREAARLAALRGRPYSSRAVGQ